MQGERRLLRLGGLRIPYPARGAPNRRSRRRLVVPEGRHHEDHAGHLVEMGAKLREGDLARDRPAAAVVTGELERFDALAAQRVPNRIAELDDRQAEVQVE